MDTLKTNATHTIGTFTAGTEILVTLSGTFGSGTATIGYIAADGTFTAFQDANGSDYAFTARGGIRATLPESDTAGKGKVAIKLESSSSAALLPNITVLR